MIDFIPDLVRSSLLVLSNATLGVLVGALLAERFLLVPYWRTLSQPEFQRLHPVFGPRLFAFFAPLTVASVVLSLATMLALRGTPRSAWSLAAFGLVASLLGFYFIYFHRGNRRLASGLLDEQELRLELRRWQRWHEGRVVVAAVALVVSLVTFAR